MILGVGMVRWTAVVPVEVVDGGFGKVCLAQAAGGAAKEVVPTKQGIKAVVRIAVNMEREITLECLARMWTAVAPA